MIAIYTSLARQSLYIMSENNYGGITMAKRGGFPGGMPGNMNNLMKQAQRMQRQMEEAQKELEEKRGSCGSWWRSS